MRIAEISETELIAVADGTAAPEVIELVERAAAENAELARSLAVWRAVALAAREEREDTRLATNRIASRMRARLQYPLPAAKESRPNLIAWLRRPLTVGAVIIALVCAGVALRGGGEDNHPRPATVQALVAEFDFEMKIRAADEGAVIRVAAGKIDENIRIVKPMRLVRAEN